MKRVLVFTKTLDNTPYIDYRELYFNLDNDTWPGWSDTAKIIKSIESKGSKSRNFPEDSFKHLINFLNNYFVERKVSEIFGFKFNANDHDFLYDKLGDLVPDFIDNEGKTVELKSGWNFDFLTGLNWYGAERKFFFNRTTSKIYEINENNEPEELCDIKVKYISLKYLKMNDKIIRFFK